MLTIIPQKDADQSHGGNEITQKKVENEEEDNQVLNAVRRRGRGDCRGGRVEPSEGRCGRSEARGAGASRRKGQSADCARLS